MKNTAQKLIIISFILAVIATIAVFLYLKALKISTEPGKKTMVLVAAETIPPRTLIDKNMVKEIQVVDSSVFDNHVNDISKVVGKYTKESIFKNEGFIMDKLIDDEGDELSLKIDSNHRAVSISVTGDSGVSDLLKPGDKVDVITFIAEKKDGVKVVSPDTAKIILQNIEVIAVDKKLTREGGVTDKATEKEKTLTNFLVTLSVEVSLVEKLVLAESIGKIKLSLRPLKGDNPVKTNGATLDELSINVNKTNKVEATNESSNEDKISTTDNIEEEKKKYTDNVNKDEKTKVIDNVSDDGITKSTEEQNIKEVNYNEETNYTVKEGDNLRKISKAFYGDEEKYSIIQAANNIGQDGLILIGQEIKIPTLK